MASKLPSSPTAKEFADVWTREIFEPAARKLAGTDQRVTASELQKTDKLNGPEALASDDLTNVFESQTAKRPGVKSLLDAAHNYALEHATKAAGSDGKLSSGEAQTLLSSLKADLISLQSGGTIVEFDDRGYDFSDNVLNDVLDRYDIDDPQSLVDTAIVRSHDKYLNKTELTEAAKSLQSASDDPEFRWTPHIMAKVLDKYGVDQDDLVAEAGKLDNGNFRLSRVELEAAAKILTTSEPATGAEIGIVSDLDKTIIPKHSGTNMPTPYPGVGSMMRELEFAQGGQAGDMYYVTARSESRIAHIPEYLEDHNIPAGPIDSGTSGLPWLAQPEKVKDVSKVFDANPDQSFVLFGDTSHRDPEVYKEIQEKYGDRVSAVFIHKVNNTVGPQRVEGMHLIENYAEAAAILFQEGIINEDAALRIMEDAQLEGLEITDTEIDTLLDTHQP